MSTALPPVYNADRICARVRELLRYDPVSGVFTNAVTRHRRAKAGDIAGSIHKAGGYIEISIDGKRYLAHRLAWLYMMGRWPENHIDHRDGDRKNNAWANLRDASRRINQQNFRHATVANRSGLLGAFRHGTRFKSSIRVNGLPKHLGYFATAIEAHHAYLRAKREYHEGCTI